MYSQICFDRDDIVAGAIGFIANAGEMLNFHPLIHVLITDGGFLKDGTFRHMLYWDTDKLEELCRAEVFRLLIEKDLIGRDTVNNMLSWKASSGVATLDGGSTHHFVQHDAKGKDVKGVTAGTASGSWKPSPIGDGASPRRSSFA